MRCGIYVFAALNNAPVVVKRARLVDGNVTSFFLSIFPLFYFCLSNKTILTHIDSPKKSGNAISEKPEICGLEEALSYGSSVQHRKNNIIRYRKVQQVKVESKCHVC